MDKLSRERASEIQEKTNPELRSCCVCKYVTYDQRAMDEHLLDHYGPKKFNCYQCRFFVCRTKEMLDDHMRLLHSDFRKFRCTDCAYRTNSHHRLLAHVRRSCRGNQDQNADDGYEDREHRYRGRVRRYNSYQRPSRDHLYFNPYLAATLSREENDKKRFDCPECGYPAGSEERLESHRRVHDSFKPYECEKCSYMGFDKSEYNSHVRSHSEECKFHCGNCNYATNHHNALKLHLRRNKHFSKMLPISDDSPVHEEIVHQPAQQKEIEIIEL